MDEEDTAVVVAMDRTGEFVVVLVMNFQSLILTMMCFYLMLMIIQRWVLGMVKAPHLQGL